MSKKNSNVNLKNGFKNFNDLSGIFINFRKKLDSLNKKNYLVAVSGGPDSLALVSIIKNLIHLISYFALFLKKPAHAL